MLGNMPKEMVPLEHGKLYWRLSLGKDITYRHYEGGWRAFEFVVIRYDKANPQGGVHPYKFRIAFAFWLPFELI